MSAITLSRSSGSNNEAFIVTKSVIFTGQASAGAVGSVPLFSTSGDVLAHVFAVCTTTLVSAGAGTIALGITNSTAAWIGATTATSITAGLNWVDTSPGRGEAIAPNTNLKIVPNGQNILSTVATGDITAGALTYYCLWRPLSAGSNITAA